MPLEEDLRTARQVDYGVGIAGGIMTGLGLEDGSRDVVCLDGGKVLEIHGERVCAGQPCVFHNPSEHRLRGAPMYWDSRLNLIWRRCEHGKLHPDPDSLAYLEACGELFFGYHPCCEGFCCEPIGG